MAIKTIQPTGDGEVSDPITPLDGTLNIIGELDSTDHIITSGEFRGQRFSNLLAPSDSYIDLTEDGTIVLSSNAVAGGGIPITGFRFQMADELFAGSSNRFVSFVNIVERLWIDQLGQLHAGAGTGLVWFNDPGTGLTVTDTNNLANAGLKFLQTNTVVGNNISLDIKETINKSSGNYTGFSLAITETSAPGTNNLLVNVSVGGDNKLTLKPVGDLIIPGDIYIGNESTDWAYHLPDEGSICWEDTSNGTPSDFNFFLWGHRSGDPECTIYFGLTDNSLVTDNTMAGFGPDYSGETDETDTLFRVSKDALSSNLIRVDGKGNIVVEGSITTISGILNLEPLTDMTRPPSGVAGRIIFNSDDGNLNIDTGANWILPDGTIT